MLISMLVALLLAPTLTFADPQVVPTYANTVKGNSYNSIAPSLTIVAYPSASCKSHGITLEKVRYGQNVSFQYTSFSLSRQLHGDERIDMFDALPSGGLVNTAYDGDVVTCSYYRYTVGGSYGYKGCHTLDEPLGCMEVFIPP